VLPRLSRSSKLTSGAESNNKSAVRSNCDRIPAARRCELRRIIRQRRWLALRRPNCCDEHWPKPRCWSCRCPDGLYERWHAIGRKRYRSHRYRRGCRNCSYWWHCRPGGDAPRCTIKSSNLQVAAAIRCARAGTNGRTTVGASGHHWSVAILCSYPNPTSDVKPGGCFIRSTTAQKQLPCRSSLLPRGRTDRQSLPDRGLCAGEDNGARSRLEDRTIGTSLTPLVRVTMPRRSRLHARRHRHRAGQFPAVRPSTTSRAARSTTNP
jgi:hypothetical protein